MPTDIKSNPVDSSYAWLRLCVALVLGTVGSVGMWSFVVALPVVQADFGATRADASLPFTMAMVGFAFGNALLGRLADRFGIIVPILLGIAALGLGYVSAGLAPSLWLVAIAHILVGFGASASFGPLIADTSHWFQRRRGIAVADRRDRQLSCRHGLAADHAAFHGERGLAADPYRHRLVLRDCDAAAVADVPPPHRHA